MKTPQTQPPIFVHALFRSGSTYAYSKFRENPEYYAYYEPFSHALIRYTRDYLRYGFKRYSPRLRHPPLKEFYFHEYPFEKEGGVRTFQKEFVVDDFFLAPDEPNPPLMRYLEHLLTHANTNAPGKRVVMQFCHSSMRMKWLKRSFAAVDAYVVRSPRNQWESSLSLPHLSLKAYTLMTIGKQIGKPWTKPLLRHIDVPKYHHGNFFRELHSYLVATDFYSPTEHYQMFYHLWLQSLLEALTCCDVLVDIDRLSANAKARAEVRERFNQRGVNVAFDDCKVRAYERHSLSPRELATAEKLIEESVKKDHRASWEQARRRIQSFKSVVTPRYLEIFD